MYNRVRSLEVVRFHRRYSVARIHKRWPEAPEKATDPESLGAQIVRGIPTDPKEYSEWLEAKRAEYADKEADLENFVYNPYLDRTDDGPDYEVLNAVQDENDATLPSELPLLAGYEADKVYIVNIDDEVLTINYGIHWKLNNIPRQDDLWARAGVDSIYPHKPTISLDLCPEEHMAELALPLPERNPTIGYRSRAVVPRTDIDGARKTFFTYLLARTIVQYKDAIVSFGREWSPDSFPFRELVFAIVSIASGETRFDIEPPIRCEVLPAEICEHECGLDHLYEIPRCSFVDGWNEGLAHAGDDFWPGDILPLLEFGSMSHLTDEAPGASPLETTYWIKDVLVSLTLVVDGGAIASAVTFGIGQGRTHFQIVIISLFDVALAEVSLDEKGEVMVRFSESLSLSPLRPEYCMSTHPRERPELKPGMAPQLESGERLIRSNCTGSTRRLRTYFPGLAALLNFFDVAADRRVASRSTVTLPTELYDHVLDFVDYETWKDCLGVSRAFRSSGLRKYRLDRQKRIVAGPFVRLRNSFNSEKRVNVKEPLLSFNIEDMKTGDIYPVMNFLSTRPHSDRDNVWAPIIDSGDRQAFMFDVLAQFKPALETPVEDDSEDGGLVE
ncbi:F-box domain-containingprotein [Apiospora sp. TS-2023a]